MCIKPPDPQLVDLTEEKEPEKVKCQCPRIGDTLHSVVDHKAPFYKCLSCGYIYCFKCTGFSHSDYGKVDAKPTHCMDKAVIFFDRIVPGSWCSWCPSMGVNTLVRLDA